jgi:hypothetical protein
MAGATSTFSELLCWRLPEDADFRGAFAEGKYPERWFGAGDVGDDSTDDASVRVILEPFEEERDRTVDVLLSESSAE